MNLVPKYSEQFCFIQLQNEDKEESHFLQVVLWWSDLTQMYAGDRPISKMFKKGEE